MKSKICLRSFLSNRQKLLQRAIALVVFIGLPTTPVLAQRAPNLVVETLAGKKLELQQLRSNGPTLVTFWALWCSPCKLELKSLQSLYEKYASRGFTVLAINQDSPKSFAKVRSYVAAQGFTFPVGLDPNGQHFQRFNGQTIPYSVLVDTSGTIISTSVGYLPGDEKKIEANVLKHLLPE